MTDVNSKQLDGAGLSHAFEIIKNNAISLASPNLTPFFSHEFYDDGYWATNTHPKTHALNSLEVLGDGWVRFEGTKFGAIGGIQALVIDQDFVKPETAYTLLVEVRNLTGNDHLTFPYSSTSGSQLIPADDSYGGDDTGWGKIDVVDGRALAHVPYQARASLDGCSRLMTLVLYVPSLSGETSFSCDIRLSLYEGNYTGPYKPYVRSYSDTDVIKSQLGTIEAPYTEVEWVESNGKQYVYTDWHPPINTFGFEADFIIRNTFNSTQAAWDASINTSNAGSVFGVRNASGVNDIEFTSYSANGLLRVGPSSNYLTSGCMKTDRTSRQTIKLHGTTLTNHDGTTKTVTRSTETADKPFMNLTVFAFHEGLRKSASGTVSYPGTVRIYSLKFFDGETLTLDLVGAIRNLDGCTGLYDKVAGHFYPAPGMTYGDSVGNLGSTNTVSGTATKASLKAIANNLADRRMWRIALPELEQLEDGQQITVTPMYTVVKSAQTTNLPGWDDTSADNTYVYMKITLADGSETDWIPCYYMAATRLTTHFGAGVPILFTYRENAFSAATDTAAGSAIMRAFYASANYNTNDNTTTNPIEYTGNKTGAIGIWQYCLCLEDGNGRLQAICTAADGTSAATTAATKVRNPNGFKVGGTVMYASTKYNANTNASGQRAVWTNSGLLDARYSFNVTRAAGQLTPYEPIYLVGTIGNDGLYYLDTVWWTQTPNDTTKVYVHVGGAYDSTTSNVRFSFLEHNMWLIYDGTKLVEYNDSRIRAVESNCVPTTRKVNGKTLSSDVTLYWDEMDQSSSDSTSISGYVGAAVTALGTEIAGIHMDGLTLDSQATHYGACSTGASTAAKAVTLATDAFSLYTGAIVYVKFTVTNTAAVANLKLNVNSTGEKAIKYRGANLPSSGTLTAGRVYQFVYDGTNWELVGDLGLMNTSDYTNFGKFTTFNSPSYLNCELDIGGVVDVPLSRNERFMFYDQMEYASYTDFTVSIPPSSLYLLKPTDASYLSNTASVTVTNVESIDNDRCLVTVMPTEQNISTGKIYVEVSASWVSYYSVDRNDAMSLVWNDHDAKILPSTASACNQIHLDSMTFCSPMVAENMF